MQLPPGTVVYYLVEPDTSQQLSGLPTSPIPSTSPPPASPPAGTLPPFGSLPPNLPIAPPGCHYVYGPPGSYIAYQLVCDGIPTPGSPPPAPPPGVPPAPPAPPVNIQWTALYRCDTDQLAAIPSANSSEILQLYNEGWCGSPQLPSFSAPTPDAAMPILESYVAIAQQLCAANVCGIPTV